MTQTKQTEMIAARCGYVVKKNAVIFHDCTPVGILVRLPGEKDFHPFYFSMEGMECQPIPAPAQT